MRKVVWVLDQELRDGHRPAARNRQFRRIRSGAIALVAACAGMSGLASAEQLDCIIEPEQMVVVAAPLIGVVETLNVERGDFVETGQIVATLLSSAEQAAVNLARARSENDAAVKGALARRDFNKRRVARGHELSRKGVVSDVELDEMESEVVVAESDLLQARENRAMASLELERAKAALDMRTIKSPLNGVVVEVMLSKGEYADPPQVMKLAQIDPLKIEAYAPVALLGRIKVGTKVQVRPEEPIGGEYEAEITVVDRVVDAASGTFGVRLRLPNPEKRVLAGLRCQIVFEPGELPAAE
jgi:RND family efflux transporter MFP subunit